MTNTDTQTTGRQDTCRNNDMIQDAILLVMCTWTSDKSTAQNQKLKMGKHKTKNRYAQKYW